MTAVEAVLGRRVGAAASRLPSASASCGEWMCYYNANPFLAPVTCEG